MKKVLLFGLLGFFACQPSETQSDTANSKVEHALVSKEVTYESDGVSMKGYLVFDSLKKGERPGILVVHEWWGHNEHSRNSANELAKLGYTAFAVDMYGDGKLAEHPKDAQAFAGEVMKNFESAKARFNAARAILESDPHTDKSKIAAIGYCFGGGIVLNLARQSADLKAVVSFHGSLGAVNIAEPGSVKARMLVLNGEDDPMVDAASLTAFKSEMDSAGANYLIVNYPNAKHAFTNPHATEKGKAFGLPLEYNKAAADNSWKRMEQFFQEVFL
ncbi:MAG: dienelactone hydrolase family protein [Bacteroidetes bacterium]|nr:MAG: dienelactone hydrolase family protein [Bacteroidota bacterium]